MTDTSVMNGKDFNEVIKLIVLNDPRFDRGAYHFVRKALDYTLKKIKESKQVRTSNHVTGPELLEGIREFALEQYGPMTYTLFEEWGLHSSGDFGEIVFNLIDYGIFGKTERDDRTDFVGVYDFKTVFIDPFQPRGFASPTPPKTTKPAASKSRSQIPPTNP
ncbi:MAG: hypothetical protein SFY80_02530 [Verrucomicrobiota bacterium]|nr:hypothetical protein [Verrucomicrobiota bacterium]